MEKKRFLINSFEIVNEKLINVCYDLINKDFNGWM